MVNKVTLIGNLGKDPEVRHLENGTSVARFSLATNESYRDKEGAWQNLTEWHTIILWRFLAQRAERELKKGSLIYVEGRLRTRSYQDSNNVERTVTEVEASSYKLLEKRERNDSSFPSESPYISDSSQKSSPPSPGASGPTSFDGGPDDDLPF